MSSGVFRNFTVASGGRGPKPAGFSRLFTAHNSLWTSSTNTNSLFAQLQALIGQVAAQGDVLQQLVVKTGGGPGLSLAQTISGSSIFGTSVLGGVAKAVSGGATWTSILSDIFPLGGLVSGILGLFDSPPAPIPLNQYDAPPSLNFDGVLGPGGQIFQGSTGASGQERASSLGLNLIDAAGGPYSPYTRAADGSLVPVAGDPVSRYTGTVYGSLPGLVASLASASPPPVAQSAPATTPPMPPPNTAQPNATRAEPQASQLPAFDQQWFSDHGAMIASAVRDQLLNLNSLVDVINDL